MNFNKNIKLLIIIITLSFIFTGCINQINKKNLEISLSSKELSKYFNKPFPLKKDFDFGTIAIKKPKILITKNSQRISATIRLDFQTMFTQKIKGVFSISGEPLFDKETSSIFLQNVKIEKLKFTNLNFGDAFSKTFLKSLSPMMDKIFKQYPIYKIPKDSFEGRFVKNVKIENSKLLITYGI